MINSIIQHEIRQVLLARKSWICFAIIQLLLALIFNWLVNRYLLNLTMIDGKYGITEEIIHPFYAWFCLLILFFIPTFTTQSICSEKVNKTILNYYSAPITPMQFILGKFFAINIVLSCMLLLISVLPLSIMLSGCLDWGQFATSIIGAYLLLNAAIAVGLTISNFMSNIARSNIAIFFVLFMLILLEWIAQFTGKYALFMQTFGLLVPLKSFLAGILNLKHVAYYCLITIGSITIAAWRYQYGNKNV